MKHYSLYLGCMIPFRFPSIEKGARYVFSSLGATLHEVKGYSCCPEPVVTRLVGEKLSGILSFRNLALAEKEKYDLLVLCNGCYETLYEAEEVYKKDEDSAEKVNELLKDYDLEYKGKIKIRHFLDVLKEDFGFETVQSHVVKFRKMKMVYHPGCHLFRGPPEKDIEERAIILQELAKLTGIEIFKYGLENLCCGFPAMSVEEAFALKERLLPKLRKIENIGSDALLLACPTCAAQFETGQMMLRKYREKFSVPCIHILELLALSFGLPIEELGLKAHRCKIEALAKKVWG